LWEFLTAAAAGVCLWEWRERRESVRSEGLEGGTPISCDGSRGPRGISDLAVTLRRGGGDKRGESYEGKK